MIQVERRTYIVDLYIKFDDCENINNAAHHKISKYLYFRFIVPDVDLGPCYLEN